MYKYNATENIAFTFAVFFKICFQLYKYDYATDNK